MSILTPRQVEFLVAAANGVPYEDIARDCFVSRSTVKTTLMVARERLDARTTGQAIIRAISYELITVDRFGVASVSAKTS